MNFKRAKINDLYLKDTHLENIFIMEYMPDAEGDFIKVYLTALMYADREDISNGLIARHLGLREEDVLRAWTYWEDRGVIRKHYKNPEDRFNYSVEFVDLREKLYSKAPAGSAPLQTENLAELPSDMDDKVVRDTFDSIQEITGRLMEGKEPETVISWIYEEALEPGLICFAYRYCVDKRRNNRFSYIASIVRDWIKEGVRTQQQAEQLLSETDQRFNQYRRVMRALGFYRSATEDEMSKIDSWFDEMGFGLDKVLEACAKTSGISNPNINYVNSILTAWHSGSSANRRQPQSSVGADDRKNAVAQVNRLYEDIRQRNKALQAERQAEVYRALPRIREIEDELRGLSLELSRLALKGGRSGVSADDLKKKITALNAEKAYMLTEKALPYDYLELQYDCRDCKDTGVLESGERCQCFSQKLKQFV